MPEFAQSVSFYLPNPLRVTPIIFPISSGVSCLPGELFATHTHAPVAFLRPLEIRQVNISNFGSGETTL